MEKEIKEEKVKIVGLYKKLHHIQSKINGLGKDKSSGVGANSYKYVTGSKILENVKPLMNDLGLLLKQEVLSIDNTRMDYLASMKQSSNGNWEGKPKSEILTKVTMKFTWIDIESGEKDENLFGANGQNDWEKGLGSALTYAERYFLLKYFHIATDEDDIDNDDRKPKEENTYQNNKQEEKKEYQESELDKKFLDVWVKLSDEQKLKIGTAYPNKFGKPQNNPQYFKKAEKEAILARLNK